MALETTPAIKSNKPVISFKDISLSYKTRSNDVTAIEDINLEIAEGEFICILGPSGCGKSTLLKLLAGFISPSKGTALMEDELIIGSDWHRGVVFQQPALYPWLNVRENVKFGLKMRHFPDKEANEIADYYLAKVGLTEFAKHKPYELSGGMRQRVAIARVLANNPKMLLMDEPFGALDALTREQMQILLRNIWWETKKTIFFITHDVEEALLLGTRIIVMSKRPGKIIKDINATFTFAATGKNSDRTRYTEDFRLQREEVLNLINNQYSDFSI